MALFKKLMVGLSSDSSILLVKNIELKLGSQVFCKLMLVRSRHSKFEFISGLFYL